MAELLDYQKLVLKLKHSESSHVERATSSSGQDPTLVLVTVEESVDVQRKYRRGDF